MAQIHLFYPLLFFMLVILIFVLGWVYKDKLNFKKDIHFKNKDTEITAGLLDKFPLVSPDFYNKSNIEQNAENNQEIHEINNKIKDINNKLSKLNIA